MKILIIGSDSFIAKLFINNYNHGNVKGISHTVKSFSNEIVISDFSQIEENVFSDIDVVINFAAIVHSPHIKDPVLYNKINNDLTVLNAQKSKKAGIKLFIQLSTVAVYGNVSNININTPYKPIDPYSWSKLKADEELLAMQSNLFKVAIIRPPMVYGGGNAPGNMLRLIKLIDKGIPLPFKGINNTRDFINVHNLIQYLSIITEKQLYGIYLISDKKPISLENLINIISGFLGKKVILFKLPDCLLHCIKLIRPNEFNKLFENLSVKTNFPYENFINHFSIENGICEMTEWYKYNRK